MWTQYVSQGNMSKRSSHHHRRTVWWIAVNWMWSANSLSHFSISLANYVQRKEKKDTTHADDTTEFNWFCDVRVAAEQIILNYSGIFRNDINSKKLILDANMRIGRMIPSHTSILEIRSNQQLNWLLTSSIQYAFDVATFFTSAIEFNWLINYLPVFDSLDREKKNRVARSSLRNNWHWH